MIYLELIEDQCFVIDVFHYSINFKLSEDISMDNKSDFVIEECINKLQGLLGNNSSSAPSSSNAPKAANISQFDVNYSACLGKAKAVCPELV